MRVCRTPEELGSASPAICSLFSDETCASCPTEQKIDDGASAPKPRPWRSIRASPTPKAASFDSNMGGRVFANSRGFRGLVPIHLLFRIGGAGGHCRTAPWSAITGSPSRANSRGWKIRTGGPHRRGTGAAAAGRGESGNAARAGDLRTAHGAQPAGQSLRSGGRPRRFIAKRRSSRASSAKRSPTSASR